MIDIHTHLLPFVDDGSCSDEESFKILKTYQKKGVKAVVLSPHYKGRFKHNAFELEKRFDEFAKKANIFGVSLTLYLGQEIHNYQGLLKDLTDKKLLTINKSKYVLFETGRSRNSDFTETIYTLIKSGYVPVVSHVERYAHITKKDIIEAKRMGALIQVNASSFFKREHRRYVKKLMKLSLIDVVASDAHTTRKNYFLMAYRRVAIRYGRERAKKLFVYNPKMIIEDC